ncbi:hypothetical protein MH117_16555 [Paenibacillus sp. ACRRX]|uniref:hypothetical protein n=1 Tax=unclassified Paenibacillus TaxID=185978 RepID=UPI001EF5CD13|nr:MULTISPECIES: hypothetical protein [unclassified Paenibacillus]MCG7409030.1 hypothetical protein [Paenibacillus sp. ACRRX]MDK8181971.1 hypothetical protein [Paenibacillus sp. UMB4589-SE434]
MTYTKEKENLQFQLNAIDASLYRLLEERKQVNVALLVFDQLEKEHSNQSLEE